VSQYEVGGFPQISNGVPCHFQMVHMICFYFNLILRLLLRPCILLKIQISSCENVFLSEGLGMITVNHVKVANYFFLDSS
jgi:hypothetical protein